MFLATLPAPAGSLLERIGAEPATSGFYLAGGSAVALHLGHRVSVDLDLFVAQEDYAGEPVVQALRRLGSLRVQQQSRGTLVGVLEGVQVSFFAYPYPLLEGPVELGSARIASLVDLGLMKLMAISQRGRLRDFVDLHAICRSGFDLRKLMDRVPEKYPEISMPDYQLLRAMAYFDDAEKDPPLRMLSPWSWQETRTFFEGQVKDLMRRYGVPGS